MFSRLKKTFWKLSIPINCFFVFYTIYGIIDGMAITNKHQSIFFAVGVLIAFVSLAIISLIISTVRFI